MDGLVIIIKVKYFIAKLLPDNDYRLPSKIVFTGQPNNYADTKFNKNTNPKGPLLVMKRSLEVLQAWRHAVT